MSTSLSLQLSHHLSPDTALSSVTQQLQLLPVYTYLLAYFVVTSAFPHLSKVKRQIWNSISTTFEVVFLSVGLEEHLACHFEHCQLIIFMATCVLVYTPTRADSCFYHNLSSSYSCFIIIDVSLLLICFQLSTTQQLTWKVKILRILSDLLERRFTLNWF